MSSLAPSIGQTLGHYRILEQIGAGGMGVVYQAYDTKLERNVALKVLPSGALADEPARKRFRREALVLAKLNHPNIETVHEFGNEGGIDFLVTEYIPGVTLDAKLSAGPLPEKQVVELGIQLAEGIAAAHHKGLVHRDLKPANLRVTSDGHLKLLDFGLASLALPANLRVTSDGHLKLLDFGLASLALPEVELARTATLTASQEITGTLPYMAPEQLRGEKADLRSDIWSTGGVLYEMATGKRPFEAKVSTALVNDIINKPAIPPVQLNPNFSPKLEDIILKCLEKDPAHRYQSAKELAIDLRRLTMLSTMPAVVKSSKFPALSRHAIAGAGFLVMAALLMAAFYAARSARTMGPASAARVMLAVLPFDNLSGDSDQEYFSDGLTEEMITQLGYLNPERVGVIARVSAMQYKRPRKTVTRIGKELGVDYIIEGGVRRMASRVRITVQLVRVRDQTYIWSHSYDGELSDYLDVQRDIAEQVAGEIRVKLAPGRRSTPGPVNPEAYEAYLKGRYYMSKRTEAGFEKAIGYFHEAIEKEPDYALAYAGLGDVYQILEQVDDARIAVAKAVQLDDQLPDAHNSLGRLLYRVDHDWAGAEREFKRALALDANYATAHHWYSIYLALSSRKPESLTEAQKAYELDPMSPIIRVHLASRLQAVGKYEKAIELLQRTIEITPDFPTLHSVWGGIYEEKGMFPEAIVEYEKALQLGGPGEELRGFVGYLYAVAGNRKEAGRVLENLKRAWPKKTHAALDIALVYAGLADKERALYWLQRANEAKVSDLSDLGQDPHFRRLHGDPRFEILVQQVGPPVR